MHTTGLWVSRLWRVSTDIIICPSRGRSGPYSDLPSVMVVLLEVRNLGEK